MANPEVKDLRTALDFLKKIPGQYAECDVEVDPLAELCGVYRYVGAGGTVKRPTRKGPAVVFNKVKGHPDTRVAIGVLSSRERVGLLLGCEPEKLGRLLLEAVEHPIDPVVTDKKPACQEVVHLATDPDFDLRKLIAAPTNTIEDAGPYLTMGECYASDPETGVSDITIHRMCIQSRDELSIYMVPGIRHIGHFYEKAEAAGKPLPICINIGVDPAIEVCTSFEPPTTPEGFNELSIAGAVRGEAVELADCVTIPEKCIAHAEYVIEGEILPGRRVAEDMNTGTGRAMPEFPGYTGLANPSLPVIKVKAVTHRKDAIMQTCIGPSEEHVSMTGIPTEASVMQMIDKALPGRVDNVYCHPSGGGKYLCVIRFKKLGPSDEGRQRQAALLAFSAFSEMKHVILVSEDVDIFDSSEILWSLNTRYQGDIDTVFIPGIGCHPLDPSQNPDYNPNIRANGVTCKTIFDCTVPYAMNERFVRAKFMELDPKKYMPDLDWD